MSYCRIIIQGNVGKDPESRFSAAGKQVVTFSVAVTDKHGQNENTTWFRCAAFDKTAEVIMTYVKKGSQILVDGRIACRKYTDKEGVARESWEVTVDRMQMLGGPSDEQMRNRKAAHDISEQGGLRGGSTATTYDDIPF